MKNFENSLQLFEQVKQGNQPASEELFHRYMKKLIYLARNRLAVKLAKRVDPEDVVMSAFRSFFVGTKDGQFSIHHSGDLWKLLATITHYKVLKQVRKQTAQKRNVNYEEADLQWNLDGTIFRKEPGPDEIVQFADQLEMIFSSLDSDLQKILELRLQDETFESIAKVTNSSERTVRRAMNRIRERLKEKFGWDEDFARLFDASPSSSRNQRFLRPQFDIRECSITIIPFSDLVLEKLIGEGGAGKVYRGEWKSQNQVVAIKYLKKRWQASEAAMQKFLVEANMIGQLEHPNIIKIYGFGQTEAGACFLVVDWIDGPNLAQKLKTKKFHETEIIECILQVSRAIEHIHNQGLIHCDLKPENILIESQRKYIVTDFGLARSLTDIQKAAPMLEGTAAYMAPEQVSDWWGPLSPSTDVYGLGAILYELLSGKPPVEGNSIPEILTSVVSAKPIDSPKQYVPTMNPALESICMKSLSKHQEDRYTSISELIRDLESLKTNKP